MSQLSYADQAAAFAGMLADIKNSDIDTGVSEEASAEIPFGVAAARGTADDQVKLPSALTSIIRGVVVHAHTYAPTIDLGDTGLKPKVAFDVLRRGRIWVTVEEAVSPGDRAHVRYAGSGQKGAFRKSEVAGETIDCTAECVFVSTAGINGLALLDVDFINN